MWIFYSSTVWYVNINQMAYQSDLRTAKKRDTRTRGGLYRKHSAKSGDTSERDYCMFGVGEHHCFARILFYLSYCSIVSRTL